MRVALAVLAAALASLGLGGCLTMDEFQRVPKVDVLAVPPLSAQAPPASAADQMAALPTAGAGSIYQPVNYRPLFEDHRARLPGDTLTITITEKVNATQTSTSTVDKGGKIDSGVTALPMVSANSFVNGRAAVQANNTTSFSGKGTVANTNDFSGTITATVLRVLPNGHLVIAAEKQIGVNANVDVLRFSGQVDPRAIQPGNSVASTSIANVRIEQRGRGQQAESQSMGWLSRFFLSIWPI